MPLPSSSSPFCNLKHAIMIKLLWKILKPQTICLHSWGAVLSEKVLHRIPSFSVCSITRVSLCRLLHSADVSLEKVSWTQTHYTLAMRVCVCFEKKSVMKESNTFQMLQWNSKVFIANSSQRQQWFPQVIWVCGETCDIRGIHNCSLQLHI